MTGATGRALLVRVDGELLPEDQARELWARFSAHMEEFKGDLAGFAAKEGFASAHPGIESGRPVLLLSRTSPQKAYAPVTSPSSGSGPPRPGHEGGRGGQGGKRRRRGR